MDYATLVAQLENYSQQVPPSTSADFIAAIPTFIQNAELTIFRSLDFLYTRDQISGFFTAGQREIDLRILPNQNLAQLLDDNTPQLTDAGVPVLTTNGGTDTNSPSPVVVQSIAAIVPSFGIVRFRPASLDWIESVWPNAALTAAPTYDNAYFTMITDTVAVIAPTPDQSYVSLITGTWRPAPMSATNPSTWLGDNLPDLLFIACMLEVSAWMREFGATSGDPQMAMTWSQRYDQAKASALEEEQRRKGFGTGWQPMSPTPFAQPPR